MRDAGFSSAKSRDLGRVIKGIYEALTRYDCLLAEVNPLVITGAGEVIVADAKVDIDETPCSATRISSLIAKSRSTTRWIARPPSRV